MDGVFGEIRNHENGYTNFFPTLYHNAIDIKLPMTNP
jgi:hypothetical protein